MKMVLEDKYALDGVDIKEGDSFSAMCGKLCRSTWQNSPFVRVHDLSHGHFRGPRGFEIINMPDDCLISAGADGIGTKVIIIDAAGTHITGAENLVRMVWGDFTRYGGFPLAFLNVLDVETLGKQGDETNKRFRELMFGLHRIAQREKFVLLGGETAELGPCVSSTNKNAVTKFNWSGFGIGVYHHEKMITGSKLRPGQVVIALRDSFRSNGISSVRKALAAKFGTEWWSNPKAEKAIIEASEPAKSYDPFLIYCNGWHEALKWGRIPPPANIRISFISHLSGGGIESKFAQDGLFPRGLSANLDALWSPSHIMRKCAEWRDLSDEECYSTWNGGQGALIVVDEGDVSRIIRVARVFNIEAKRCGEIVKTRKPRVRIVSQFSGKKFFYRPK